MATIAEMRRALRDAGRPVGVKGRLSAEQKREASAILADWQAADDQAAAAAAGPADSYADGTGPDDFAPDPEDYLSADLPPGAGPAAGVDMGEPGPGPADAGGSAGDDHSGGVTAEQRPRQVGPRRGSTAGAAAGVGRWWSGLGARREKRAKAARARARARAKARPGGTGGARLSGAPIIEHVLSQLAWAARPMPPLQKVLAMQATTSGVLLDQAFANTPVDVALQFAARQEERAQIVNGTIGPVAWVLAITLLGGAQTISGPGGQPVVLLDQDQVPVWDQRTRMMVNGLRFSLMSYRKICQRSAAELQAAAEENAAAGAEADDLIKFFFATPQPGETPHDRERAAEEAGAKFTGQAPPPWQPPPGAAVMVPFAGATQEDLTEGMEAAARGAAAPWPATGAHGGS